MENSNGMISIIIPTLNEEKVIEKTLKSLREYQGDYEIIVSDGKSTDKTVEIARKYADQVVVYEGTARQTIGMGRNLGAYVAKGDYLLFLDADITIPELNGTIKRALSFFEKNKKLYGLTVFLKVNPTEATFADNFFFGLVNWIYYIQNSIFHYGVSGGDFQMFRSDIFKNVGGYNEKLVAAEDCDLFRRFSKIGETRAEPSVVAYLTARRIHKVGWLPLLWKWHLNWLSMTFLKKSVDDEWKVIR